MLRIFKKIMNFSKYNFILLMSFLYLVNCGGSKPDLQVSSIAPSINNNPDISQKNNALISKVDTNEESKDVRIDAVEENLNIENTSENNFSNTFQSVEINIDKNKEDNPYSNYIRVKTVYELATESNPPMFLPQDTLLN